MKDINEETVQCLIDTVSCGLSHGVGTPEPGKMCIEAAVCYALGLPHGDNPPCVGSAVRSYKIRLNDANWSSNAARAKGMLGVGIAQLGSDKLDQREFAKRITLKTINTIIADLAKKYLPAKEQEFRAVDDLERAKELCLELKKAASAYASSASAADAAASSASAYASSASAADAAADAYAAERDKVLTQGANNCLEVLKEMGSPGCEYLYLIKD